MSAGNPILGTQRDFWGKLQKIDPDYKQTHENASTYRNIENIGKFRCREVPGALFKEDVCFESKHIFF